MEADTEPRQQNAVTLTPAAHVNAAPPPPEPHASTRGDKARRVSNGRNMLLSPQVAGYEYGVLRTRTKNLIAAFDQKGICPGCAKYNTWEPRYVKVDLIHRNTVERVGGTSDVPTHCCLNCKNRDDVDMYLEQLKGTKAHAAYLHPHTAKCTEIHTQVSWLYSDDHEHYDSAISRLPGRQSSGGQNWGSQGWAAS
jgi:hypothetical protein